MKRNILMLAAIFSAAALNAQDLDPTVEVSRVYEGKLIDVHKPAMDMAVPDSVHRFDLDFDYSVFENPYRGAYEFNPYYMDMKPQPSYVKPSSFYMKAGAGYTLHPMLDVLYSPDFGKPVSLDVYAHHRSYVGKYRALSGNPQMSGYDLLSRAGADVGYEWKKAAFKVGASYYGVAAKDQFKDNDFNALDAFVALKSKSSWPKHFMYDLKAAYRFGGEKGLQEHDFNFDASFGPSFNETSKVFFDLGVQCGVTEGNASSSVGNFYFVPHYIHQKKRLKMDLGVRISATLASGHYAKAQQYVYPDLHVSYAVIKDAMRLYLHVGGGEDVITYSSLLSRNHHLTQDYAFGGYLLGTAVERVNPEIGIEGRISSFFSYDLKAGYSAMHNSPVDVLVTGGDGSLRPAFDYASYQRCYAQLDWDLDLEAFRFSGDIAYSHVWKLPEHSTALYVAPSPLSGYGSAVYNWNKRLYAGVDCEFALARLKGKVPGYADLGVELEYVLNRKLSFWLRGGNLLNMEIQRNVLFAEKGVHFIAGICLKL